MLTFADVELDQESYEVRRAGHLVDLSPTEFRLLRYLMLNPGLGLAIVAEIATAHKGTAEAALDYPHGPRITLTLPAWTGPRPAEVPAVTGRDTPA